VITLGSATASAIWDLLIREAGASEHQRLEFLQLATSGLTEFRFQGTLGFGGKFYGTRDKWRIACYREDETPERLAVIKVVNGELEIMRLFRIVNTKTDAELQAELDAINPADCPPVSEERLDEMVRYATDPVYRALHDRCYAAERELREIKAIGWIAWCSWRDSSYVYRDMKRLAEACTPKDQTENESEESTNAR
jgi:hypothetical protein